MMNEADPNEMLIRSISSFNIQRIYGSGMWEI